VLPLPAAIASWLRPPDHANDDLNRRALALRRIGWGTLWIFGAYLFVIVLFQPATLGRRTATFGAMAAISLITHLLNRRGYTNQASWLFLALMIAFFTQLAWTTGGIHAPVTPIYLLIILMGGVLLRGRGARFAAFGSVAAAASLVIAERTGVIVPRELLGSAVPKFIFLTMVVAMTVLLQRMITRALLDGLHRAEDEIARRTVSELQREHLVWQLGERVKELTLLHETARTQQRTWPSLEKLLEHVLVRIPPAWQFPAITEARITLGSVVLATPGWRVTPWKQTVAFTLRDQAGTIDVVYTEERPLSDEGPFLKEERALINSLAEMLVAIIESMRSRKELEDLVAARTQALTENLEALKTMEGLRDDLVQMIVHDIRGLLLVVLANLEMAQPEVSGTAAEDIAAATGAAQALNRMANDLLDVSRLEDGKMPISKTATDLIAVAQASARAIGALDPMRTIEVGGGPVIATCDQALIRRVVDNLVSNAVKHTPAGGKVRIAAASDGTRVRLHVQDEGSGVPPQMRTRIFQKFAAARTDSRYHSAGLGLAFCRLAVEAHGGSIGVEPATPRGSIFTFEIPA
jgi:signal transduction histidine kinase